MSEYLHREVADVLISAGNNGDADRRVRASTQASSVMVRPVVDTVNGYRSRQWLRLKGFGACLRGEGRPGFQNPAGLLENGFVETIADTRITKIETLEG